MTSLRKTAIVVGVLFIIGTAAGVLSGLVTMPILENPDYLVQAAAKPNQLILGALFVLLMGFPLVLVPAVMFPIFRKVNEPLAVGYIVFRSVLEGVCYLGITLSWLLLLSLSRDYALAGTPDASSFQLLGRLLQDSGDWIGQLLAIAFSLGAIILYYLFYQSRLIPRWLSVWGLLGAMVYLAAPMLSLFGYPFDIVMAPLAIQEMVLAIWLIARGFTDSGTEIGVDNRPKHREKPSTA